MHNEDWIIGQVRNIGAAMAKLLGLASTELHDVQEADTAARGLLDGYGLPLLVTMSVATILGAFAPGNPGLEPHQSLAVANAMVDIAAEAEVSGDPRADALYLRAVALYAELDTLEPRRAALAASRAVRVPPKARGWAALVTVNERLGALADAEDALFALARLDAELGRSVGTAFYARLVALEDDHLEAGGLDRDDLALGWAQLHEVIRSA